MSDDSSPVEPPDFNIKKLDHFPHFFSDEEQLKLRRWGQHATDLTDGSVEPSSEKERIFVEVACGIRPPETSFHRLWLRYHQAMAIESKLETNRKSVNAANLKLRALEDELREINNGNSARAANLKIRALEDELRAKKYKIETLGDDVLSPESPYEKINRLQIWGKTGWEQVEQLKVESAKKIMELESRIRQLQAQIQPQISALAPAVSDRGNKRDYTDTWDGGGNDWREQK